MKRMLLIPLLAVAASVAPAAASAHDGWHHRHDRALYAKLAGTGTLASAHGSLTSTTLGTGTFTAAVTPTGSATVHTGSRGTLSCTPASAALTLTGTSTATATLTGRSCTWTPAGSTASTGVFWGRGNELQAFLVAKPDGSVRGAVFRRTMLPVVRLDAFRTGHCDGDRDGR